MKQIPRRKVLQWGLGAGAMGALAACRAACTETRSDHHDPAARAVDAPTTTTSTTTTSTTTTTTTLPPPPPVGTRSLVVIDMAGGHDGNSLGIPFADGAYYSRRPTVSIPANQVRQLNNQFGLHPNLARVHRRPLALVEGLGHPNPDFSHSEMLRRWWFGDTDGKQFPRYGFLGRLCDVIATPNDAATGVSLGWGPSASLAAQNAVTLSMDPYGDGSFPGYDDPGMHAAWIAAHRAMSQEDRAEATMLFAGRTGIRTALHFSDLLTAIPDSTIAYPDTTLGAQLAAAVRLHPRRRRHPHRARAVRRRLRHARGPPVAARRPHDRARRRARRLPPGARRPGTHPARARRHHQRVRSARDPERQRPRPRHRDRRAARRCDPPRRVRPAPQLDDPRHQRQPEVHRHHGRLLRDPGALDGREPRRRPRGHPDTPARRHGLGPLRPRAAPDETRSHDDDHAHHHVATLGHVAMHYRPGDGERSRLLFECLGARSTTTVRPGFCTIVVRATTGTTSTT